MVTFEYNCENQIFFGQVWSRKNLLVCFYWLNHARNDRITSFKHVAEEAMFFFSANLRFFPSISVQLLTYQLFVQKKSIICHISLMQRVLIFLFYRKVILMSTLTYCNISLSSPHTSEIWRFSLLKFYPFFGCENYEKIILFLCK